MRRLSPGHGTEMKKKRIKKGGQLIIQNKMAFQSTKGSILNYQRHTPKDRRNRFPNVSVFFDFVVGINGIEDVPNGVIIAHRPLLGVVGLRNLMRCPLFFSGHETEVKE